jgi:hypothetical protein
MVRAQEEVGRHAIAPPGQEGSTIETAVEIVRGWFHSHNSPPGTGGVARSDGVVDGSNDSPKPFRPYYHPGLRPPLLFQEGSCVPSPSPSLLRMHSEVFRDDAALLIQDIHALTRDLPSGERQNPSRRNPDSALLSFSKSTPASPC